MLHVTLFSSNGSSSSNTASGSTPKRHWGQSTTTAQPRKQQREGGRRFQQRPGPVDNGGGRVGPLLLPLQTSKLGKISILNVFFTGYIGVVLSVCDKCANFKIWKTCKTCTVGQLCPCTCQPLIKFPYLSITTICTLVVVAKHFVIVVFQKV